MANFIKGYICRSKATDRIMISTGSKPPEREEKIGWYQHIPGWFCTLSIRTFKRNFGFSIKPGTHKQINISISEKG